MLPIDVVIPVNMIIPEEQWEWDKFDGEREHLKTKFCINGVGHHVDAYKVITRSGTQEIVNDGDFLQDLHFVAGEPSGPYATVKIFDEDYLIVITPFTR
jgi:hypothetical protein